MLRLPTCRMFGSSLQVAVGIQELSTIFLEAAEPSQFLQLSAPGVFRWCRDSIQRGLATICPCDEPDFVVRALGSSIKRACFDDPKQDVHAAGVNLIRSRKLVWKETAGNRRGSSNHSTGLSQAHRMRCFTNKRSCMSCRVNCMRLQGSGSGLRRGI